MPRRRVSPLLVAALAVLAVLLAGCGGGAQSSGGSSASADADAGGGSVEAPDAEMSESLADESADASADADGSSGAARTAAIQRAVVSTGDVQLRTRDVARARAEVVRLTASWGGTVADEESLSDDDGRASYTSMTLRVPSDRFDPAMAALAEVAELAGQSRTAEDVTTQVVDVAARVRVQERSVRRIEALLAEAESLRDIISIEGDLAQRQAELDSLKSQQAYLDDQTSLSTITLGIDLARGERPKADDSGFVAGLTSGWGALGGSLTALSTAAGAVLPFAVLLGALTLLALPLLRVVRRRRARVA